MGIEIIQYFSKRRKSVDEFYDDILEEERGEILEIIEYCQKNNFLFVVSILSEYYNNNF